MFKSDRIAQVATALVGAVILSALSVGAAVGPARAGEPGQSWISAASLVAPDTEVRTGA